MAEPVLVQAAAGGARLRLRVKPGARRQRVVGPHGGALKLEVAAPPERGRANQAVLDLLAELLALPPEALELTSGAASQDKSVLVHRPPEELVRRLVAAGVSASE